MPSQYGERTIETLIRVLYHSEANLTLGEKMVSNAPGNDPYFHQAYKQINPEIYYGHIGKDYLRARQVKNLRVEESHKDMAESTLYWTELPKFIWNPDFDNNGPMPADLSVLTKQVRAEMDLSYTYSIQTALDEFKHRRDIAQSQGER
jgi:hypothetical protein